MCLIMLTPYGHWPFWLRFVVVVPHAILASLLLLRWWPETRREWQRFGIAFAYLSVFLIVMVYVFKY